MTFKNLPEIISVKVQANAQKTELREVMSDGTLKIALKSAREGGKANAELLKFLKQKTANDWRIIAGKTASRKKIRKIY